MLELRILIHRLETRQNEQKDKWLSSEHSHVKNYDRVINKRTTQQPINLHGLITGFHNFDLCWQFHNAMKAVGYFKNPTLNTSPSVPVAAYLWQLYRGHCLWGSLRGRPRAYRKLINVVHVSGAYMSEAEGEILPFKMSWHGIPTVKQCLSIAFLQNYTVN